MGWLWNVLLGGFFVVWLSIASVILVVIIGLKLGWLEGFEKAETPEKFYRVVDQAYDDWDRDFETGPSRLSVWVKLEPHPSSGSFFRDFVRAYETWNDHERPTIELIAFMNKRRPVSVIVSPADRPGVRPFASFFPEEYPVKLINELTLIEWRQSLLKRWPKAVVTMHYFSGGNEPGGWRKQLEHAERYILEQQGHIPHA